MSFFQTLLVILLFLILAEASISVVFGMPGTLISFIAILGFVIITKAHYIGWITVIIFGVLTLIGELGETLWGIKDAKRAGVSRKGLIASVGGSIAGSIVLAPFLLGIGALFGAVIGAFAGAFIVTLAEAKGLDNATRGSIAAAFGRLKGTLLKGFIVIAMTVVCFLEIVF